MFNIDEIYLSLKILENINFIVTICVLRSYCKFVFISWALDYIFNVKVIVKKPSETRFICYLSFFRYWMEIKSVIIKSIHRAWVSVAVKKLVLKFHFLTLTAWKSRAPDFKCYRSYAYKSNIMNIFDENTINSYIELFT